MTTRKSPLSDEELAGRAGAGDRAALRELLDRHRPHLRRAARQALPRRLRRKLDESDVVQEASFAVSERLPEFENRGPGSFLAWVRQILQHKALDAVRRHLGAAKRCAAREVSVAGSGPRPDRPGNRTSPSQAAIRREEGERLLGAMERLPADQRRALRLVHLQGHTLAEAGAVMDRSGEAVRKLYGRAIGALAELLRSEGRPTRGP